MKMRRGFVSTVFFLYVLIACLVFSGCASGEDSAGNVTTSVHTVGGISQESQEDVLSVSTEDTDTELSAAVAEEVVTEADSAEIVTEADSQETAGENSKESSQDSAAQDGTDAASSETVQTASAGTKAQQSQNLPSASTGAFDISTVPAYTGSPYVEVNGNVPYFTQSDLTTTSYESYSKLDSKGRCGVAVACVGTDLMPTEERGEIGSVKPTGWHTVKYDCVSGKYLYNRCHLIAYELAGENANEKNLITGTRYFNVEGMLPFENMVHDYVVETENHVLYRVTPVFEGNNLVASGALMEAYSVEDDGDGIEFCVYCYNVQPGIVIDYATGDSYEDGSASSSSSSSASSKSDAAEQTYILNTSTKKFHLPSCSSVNQMAEKNTLEYTGTRDDVIAMGYDPCKRCNP